MCVFTSGLTRPFVLVLVHDNSDGSRPIGWEERELLALPLLRYCRPKDVAVCVMKRQHKSAVERARKRMQDIRASIRGDLSNITYLPLVFVVRITSGPEMRRRGGKVEL